MALLEKTTCYRGPLDGQVFRNFETTAAIAVYEMFLANAALLTPYPDCPPTQKVPIWSPLVVPAGPDRLHPTHIEAKNEWGTVIGFYLLEDGRLVWRERDSSPAGSPP